jgi:hypothetical protein
MGMAASSFERCGEMEEGKTKPEKKWPWGSVAASRRIREFLFSFSEEQTEGINGVVTSTGFQARNVASKVRALP